MAILINKNMNILGGLSLSQLYLRIEYFVGLSGKNINCNVYPYFNKESFKSSPIDNVLKINEIKSYYNIQYNNDGDLLLFLHNKIKNDLSTDIYKNTSIEDPSTGELITQKILVKEKFVDEKDISFIDLD